MVSGTATLQMRCIRVARATGSRLRQPENFFATDYDT